MGIAYGTLNDYLLWIKKGIKYGFDFNRNKKKKMSFLNKFIKSKKKD